jgi:hypothetical protein
MLSFGVCHSLEMEISNHYIPKVLERQICVLVYELINVGDYDV